VLNLENKYKDCDALLIFGGSSIIQNNYDLSKIANKELTIFIEANTLTPKFIEYGLKPNYYLNPYPEKARTNSIQKIYLQSISSGFPLEKVLKEEFLNEWLDFRENFGKYAQINNINFPHKRYRIRNNIILNNSPLSFISNFPEMSLISNEMAYKLDGFGKNPIENKTYLFNFEDKRARNYSNYFSPRIIDGGLTITDMGFLNSAASSMYPILKFLGFKKVYLMGMDMSMVGSMEYSAPYTFKSMRGFKKFFNHSRRTYSHNFPLGLTKGLKQFLKSSYRDMRLKNIKGTKDNLLELRNNLFGLSGKFMRETSQLHDLPIIFNHSEMEYINIFDKCSFAQPIPKVKNITFEQFTQE